MPLRKTLRDARTAFTASGGFRLTFPSKPVHGPLCRAVRRSFCENEDVVAAFAKRLAIPIHDQRHQAQAEALQERRPQVGCAVGYDADRRHSSEAT